MVSILNEQQNRKRTGSIKRDISKKKKRPTAQRDIPKHKREDALGRKMDINEQTIAQRRNARADKNINPNSPEVKRGARRNQGYKINNKKKKGMSRAAMVYTVGFIAIFLLVSLVCVVAFHLNLTWVSRAEYSSIKLKICLQHEEETTKASYVNVDSYYRDGIMYVNMTDIATKFDFLMTGDNKELRFITNEKTGEEVRFLLGTAYATVNGTGIRLNGNVVKTVVKDEEHIFVPASFITEYMKGITFSFDEEECIMRVLRDTERNEAGRFVESDISFKLKFDKASTSVVESELTEAQQARCYFKNISSLPTIDNTNLQG